MTAPFVRVWLAQRIRDFNDFWWDAWFTFVPGADEFWRHVAPAYRPAPASGVAVDDGPEGAGTRQDAGALTDLPRLRVCRRDLGGCGAQPGQRCTTGDGKVTREHKARLVTS